MSETNVDEQDEPEVEYFGLPTPRKLSARQIAKRNAVLAAAADAFTDRGYAATSIDDIADRLGATKGRVYHYFRTKGEIFVGIHRTAMEMVLEAVRPLATAESDPPERLYDMAVAHARLMMQEYSFMRLAVQHAEMNLAREGRTQDSDIDDVFAMREEYEALFRDVIADGIQSGHFGGGDPSILAKAVLGSLNWMSVWYRPSGDNGGKDDEIVETIATFVTAGVTAQAG